MSELVHDPAFWTALAFVIFVVVMFKPLKKALLAGLDSRIEQIRKEVEEAPRPRRRWKSC
jgi:F-type H+-transporting ATPase subunit b